MDFLARFFKHRRAPAPAPPAQPAVAASPHTGQPVLAKIGSAGQPYPGLLTLIRNFEQGETSAETLVFGDSVMERVAREDDDRRTLGQMISDELRPASTAVVSASANNPLVYRWLLSALAKMPRQPSTIIIPINLRCFSPQWHLNPDWQMKQEITLLAEYTENGLEDVPPIADVFRDDPAHEALAAMPLSFPLSQRRTMGEFRALVHEPPSHERSRDIFVFHYTHRLTGDHPKLKALAEAVDIAFGIAERVLLYITPINVEAAERFVGSNFRGLIADNVEVIRGRLGVELHDWHDRLPDEAFFHGDTATEHLNQSGRLALANIITITQKELRKR